MTRLSIDQAAWQRGLTDAPLHEEAHAEIESDLRRELMTLVRSRRDVVLDLSFWSRAMREDYRRLLAPEGVVPETVYLATDRETVLARVRARRGAHADDMVLDEERAAAYVDHFEPPTPDEGPLTVIT